MKRSPLKRKARIRRLHPTTANHMRAYSLFRGLFLRRHPVLKDKELPGNFRSKGISGKIKL